MAVHDLLYIFLAIFGAILAIAMGVASGRIANPGRRRFAIWSLILIPVAAYVIFTLALPAIWLSETGYSFLMVWNLVLYGLPLILWCLLAFFGFGHGRRTSRDYRENR